MQCLNEESFPLARQREVEATTAKEFVGRGHSHDFKNLLVPGALNTPTHQFPTHTLSLNVVRDRKAADLSEFDRVNLECGESHDLAVAVGDEAVGQKFLQFPCRSRQQSPFLNKWLNEFHQV